MLKRVIIYICNKNLNFQLDNTTILYMITEKSNTYNERNTNYNEWQTKSLNIFNKRIKQLMVEYEISRIDLAAKLGITPAALSLSRPDGDYSPTMSRMKDYANVFGVEIWETIYDCGVSKKGLVGKPVPLLWQTQDELNEFIKAVMKRKGVTMAAIAKALGTSNQVVSANLKSKKMSLAILFRLAYGIGVEPWELLIDREDMEREVARRKNGGKEVKSTEVKSAAKQSWDDATPELFIERVKALLDERCWTRKQLADMLGVGVTGLILDKKKAFPSISVMQKYADVFGVQIWEMIYDCGVSAYGVKGYSEPLKWHTQEELNLRIADVMHRMGVTQAQLSARLGISTSLLSANLNSKSMSLLILQRLAKGLGLEPWELLIDREDMEREVARRKNDGKVVDSDKKIQTSSRVNEGQSWNESTLNVNEERKKAIPLRVIRIIRCPYCHNEISLDSED